MKPEDFEMVETLDGEALARHPVWKTYRAGDRPWVLGFGVEPSWLDAELERFAYCGPEPLFPVLECDPLPEGRNELIVAAECTLACGSVLPGYVMEPLAFGIFGEQEYAFNRGLPRYGLQVAERLAAELGVGRDEVFPVRWRAAVRGPDGEPWAGEIPAFW